MRAYEIKWGGKMKKIIKGISEAEFKITSFTMCAVLSRSVVSNSLRPHGLQPIRLLCPWRFSRQEYWIELSCPLWKIFLTQGLNPGLPYCRWILYSLDYSNLKRNKILIHATTWINLVNITLSETNKIPKDKYCMLPII